MILIVRCFAPAATPADAEAVSRHLRARLASFPLAPPARPEPYWKVPGWYEHTVRMAPATEATFDTLLALTPGGWQPVIRDGECSAVWNPAPGTSFLHPDVTWAELLLIHEP